MSYFRLIVLAVGLLAPYAYGQETELEIQINQGVFGYAGASSETKVDGGDSVDSDSTSFDTMPADLEVVLVVNSLLLYVYPTAPGTAFGIGYAVTDPLELGFTIGRASATSEVGDIEDESEMTEYGIYAVFAYDLGIVGLESGVSISQMQGSSKASNVDDTTGQVTVVKTDEVTSSYGVSVDVVLPIAKGFSYVGGVSYDWETYEEKKSKTERDTQTLGVNLATLRLDF